jgi:hypothetical protein
MKISIEECLEQALNYKDGILENKYKRTDIYAGVNIFKRDNEVSALEINIYHEKTDIKLLRVLGTYNNKYKIFKFELPKLLWRG